MIALGSLRAAALLAPACWAERPAAKAPAWRCMKYSMPASASSYSSVSPPRLEESASISASLLCSSSIRSMIHEIAADSDVDASHCSAARSAQSTGKPMPIRLSIIACLGL
jgi:hypothetical protein